MGFFLVSALLLTSVHVDATRPPPHMLDLYDSSKAGITSKRPPPRPGRPAGRGWRTAMRVLATGTIRGGVDGFVRRGWVWPRRLPKRDPDAGRDQHPAGDALLQGSDESLWRRALRPGRLQRIRLSFFSVAIGWLGFGFRCFARCRSRRASWNRTSDLANVPSPWRSPPSSRRRRRTTWRRTCSMPRGGSRRGRDSRSDYARARSIKVVRPGDNARFVLFARSDRTLLAHPASATPADNWLTNMAGRRAKSKKRSGASSRSTTPPDHP